MRRAAMAVYAILALTLAVGAVSVASGQSDQPAAVSAPAAGDADMVTGHPFSAASYVRTVRNLPNGKQQLIRYERFPYELARDRDGRDPI